MVFWAGTGEGCRAFYIRLRPDSRLPASLLKQRVCAGPTGWGWRWANNAMALLKGRRWSRLRARSAVLPVCCNRHGQECFYECFCQQIFRVTHREKKQDISKVAYRIIGRKEYVEKIIGKNRIGKQIIQWSLQNNKYIPVQNCIFTENYEEMFDSFKLQG